MNLEVRHLQLMEAVAADGTLTKAGERLHLSQSALSRQLVDLEERLGTRLFNRVSKRMLLTTAGERVLALARRVLDEIRAAEDDLQLLAGGRRGRLRITIGCSTGYHWLPPIIEKFAATNPGIDVSIDANATSRATAAVLDGSVDLAITDSPIADRRLRATPLFKDEMLVIAAPSHPFAKRQSITPRELAGETLLVYDALESSTAYQRVLRPAGLQPKAVMRVPLTEAMVELVRAGIGIAVMPRWSVWPQLSARVLHGASLGRRGLVRHWNAVTLRACEPASFVTDFIDLLIAQRPRERDVPAIRAAAPRAARSRSATSPGGCPPARRR
jgi:LysR family transcriptional regulator for metE and metH